MTRPASILVTGATGFLGSHVVRRLAEAGRQVVALKRSTSSLDRLRAVADRVALADADRTPPDALFREHPGIGVVVHTLTCYGRHGETEAAVREANTEYPLRLLAEALEAGVGLFINTDTVLPPDTNAYARSKRDFRTRARALCAGRPVRLVNVRLEQVFGPGDDPSKFTTYVIRGCARDVPALDLTPGEQRRDFIYVDDAVDAFVLLAGTPPERLRPFEELDLGSGRPVTVREFAERVKRLAGSRTRLRFGARPYRDNEVMESRADTGALERMGWRPRVELEDGIARTVAGERPA